MAWKFNFCSPYLSNDPIINANRAAQVLEVLLMLIAYICISTFFSFFKRQTDSSTYLIDEDLKKQPKIMKDKGGYW